jgi:hypothetical protein
MKIHVAVVTATSVLSAGVAAAGPLESVFVGAAGRPDSLCTASATDATATDSITSIGEHFGNGVNNFCFAFVSADSYATGQAATFALSGPNAGDPLTDRLRIESAAAARLINSTTWSSGSALGRASVDFDISLPHGGRFAVLGGTLTSTPGGSASIVLRSAMGSVVFEHRSPTTQTPSGVLTPGTYFLTIESRAEAHLGGVLASSAQIDAQFRVLRNRSCPGDLDVSTVVDDADFVIFAGAYETLLCDDLAMPTWCPADFSADDVVDDIDFQIFASAYEALVCP